MEKILRLPALPLVTQDPYFSIWCPGDRLTDVDTAHWAGAVKRLRAAVSVDGQAYRILGLGDTPALTTVEQRITATSTYVTMEGSGIRAQLQFTSPLLPADPDLMSTPITIISVKAEAIDGKNHQLALDFKAYNELTYDAGSPELFRDAYSWCGMTLAWVGQKRQGLLCHSGDHITIDWGYLMLASHSAVEAQEDGLAASAKGENSVTMNLYLGYDDVASIDYFGVPTKAWYARNGKTLPDAMAEFDQNREKILADCAAMDARVDADAMARGGEDYALLCAAAFRQCIAAHKLIADENGKMVLLSKEDDSNGCIGTVDVSYPSTPLFLKYNPELVRALCRPVMRFAKLPVWEFDFAPHDVGRYPHANGQVYALKRRVENGDVYPPHYLYPAGTGVYDDRYQMPVEECGNMILMLSAAAFFDGDFAMSESDKALLARWAQYLERYGEDPGEQLCTDDFAGHLARNVNLSAKAITGLAVYARLLDAWGQKDEAKAMDQNAKTMAASWLKRCAKADGTALTFDGNGWSMKYNLVWDKVMSLGLLSDDFYKAEIASYIPRMNVYGLPLDSRKAYTKADWILWTAAMTDDRKVFDCFTAPMVRFLRESGSRVAFSDWYNTETGLYEHFIARSVIGGIFMPLLTK